jgi:hypothetical protein
VTTISTLGDAVTLHHAVGGKTQCVLAEHRSESRLTPLIRYYELDGSEHVLELSVADVNSIMASLIRMHEAERPEVAAWYRKLTQKG